MDADEQVFDSIYRTLAMSGEYENKEYLIEDQVHEIMDNPHIYPEYFNWLSTTLTMSMPVILHHLALSINQVTMIMRSL